MAHYSGLTELFFDMDGRFPNHHPNPTVLKNLAHLIAAVKEKGAELGIAFDGDSDRIGAVDENGEVFGDHLMIIYSREILSRKPGATIIGEVRCSQTLYGDIRQHGGNGIMWKTGHSLIKAKMKEEHAELAGEMSVLRRPLLRLRRRALRRLPADRDCRKFRTGALGATGRCSQDFLNSRDPRGLSGRSEIWSCRAGDGAFPQVVLRYGRGRGARLVSRTAGDWSALLRFEATSLELLQQYRQEVEKVVEHAGV